MNRHANMASDGPSMQIGASSNLDLVRQRAQKAAEFYHQQQQRENKTDPVAGLSHPSQVGQGSHPDNFGSKHNNNNSSDVDMGRSSHNNVSRILADDSFDPVAPSSSNSFYRAKMRAGIIDMRSSYNERIGSRGNNRGRARTFHGPHTGSRPRTQTYAIENNKSGHTHLPSTSVPSSSSTAHSQHPAPQKPARTYATASNRTLYRSSSDLEVDSGDVEAPAPAPSNLHREYGSTSSLDVLSTSTDNFFSMLSEFQHNRALDQRSPAPPRLQELLQGRLGANSEPQIPSIDTGKGSIRFLNGVPISNKEPPEDETDGVKPKTKTKHKDRKQRAKSITGEASASILKKLRGKTDSDIPATKSEERIGVGEDVQGKSDDHGRRRAFVHFDCQSVGVDLTQVMQQRLSGFNYKNNITTGASAASGQRSSLAPDKDDPDLLSDPDEGDDKSNDLVLSCPYFRNELGGEDERTVSLTRSTAHKRVNSSVTNAVPVSQNFPGYVRHPACCGVAILDSSPTPSGQILPPLVSHRSHVIEYVDHGAYYYRHFFYSHDHQNLFGCDENLGPIAISIRREKLDLDERANNLGRAEYGLAQYRIICRTSELSTLRGCVLEEAIPAKLSSSRGIPVKDVLEVAMPEVQLSCMKLGIAGEKAYEQLLKLDEQGISKTYKVGIMYCKANQSSEEEMYNNESGGPAFEDFLNLISQRVRLKGFEKYRAGLDCKSDTTGTHSFYTTFNDNEIMFHVSTMLPFTPNNKQQLLRKRHIGNDIVTIIFQEPGALPFTPQTVRSQFQHVFIIVRVTNPNSDNTRYSMAITRSKDVPPFGPPIPENCSFKKSQDFVDFLLAKVINSENAAHKCEKFRTMAKRTRQEYLKDLATNYVTSTAVDSGSKLSKFGLGSGRKKEKTKLKVVPDMYAKGALVWEVLVEDAGAASQVTCLLAIAADTIVLLEETNKDVIFTIPCSTLIGWTPQPSSLRLYFGSGECLLMRPHSGEVEEMHEIITRLQAVTNGIETSKMALKRNGLGQLGFHIQSEGIVTDVEKFGFAWEGGLRKGSRLVEICKVATTTLSHDQIVDLLRTSAVVKVVVVPPMDDGSPRGFVTPSSHFSSCPMMSLSSLLISDHLQQQQKQQQQQNQEKTSPPVIAGDVTDCPPPPQPPDYNETLLMLAQARGDNSVAAASSTSPPLPSKSSPPSTLQHPHQQQQQHYESSPRQRSATSQHGYSDSTLSSGRSSDDGRSSYMSHVRQGSGEGYGSIRSQEGYTSSGDELHSRNNSHDSSDYAMSAISNRSRTSQHSQPPLRRGERVQVSMETVDSSPGSGKRQFANMEYTSGIPATGNIALELLKQTQNTKYLLGQGHSQQQSGRTNQQDNLNPGSASNLSQISEGSSSGSSQYNPRQVVSAVDESNQRRKDGLSGRISKPVMKKGFTEPSANSPKVPRRNLSGMSSEESLSSTSHRTGAPNQKVTRQQARADFQEELMRLIDPDLSEKDLVGLSNLQTRNSSTVQRLARLQRTLSDESLTNSKTATSDLGQGGGEVSNHRLSPRAISDLATARQRSKSTVDNRILPAMESAATLDWSKLVSVACKAIDDNETGVQLTGTTHLFPDKTDDTGEDHPPPRPPSPQMNVALSSSPSSMSTSYLSSTNSASPQQRIQELEAHLSKMHQQLEKAQKDKSVMEIEIQELRVDNVRLQEESQTAATHLRRFTEWFFNTIDRQ